jgi:hypothetical protein
VEDSYDLQKPNIDITASNARINVGQLLSNTTGLKITIQEEVTSRLTSNYNGYILKERMLILWFGSPCIIILSTESTKRCSKFSSLLLDV